LINKKKNFFLFIVFFKEHCAGAGLYLESSNEQRSTQCTYLQQGHNYLSDTNSLYINFYSRTPTVRGGFWIIYEGLNFITYFLFIINDFIY